MALYEEILTLPRMKDRIKVEIVDGYESLCWIAYRENGWGGWEKIPAMSRAECRAFPKSVGHAANAILERYRRQQPYCEACGSTEDVRPYKHRMLCPGDAPRDTTQE